MAQNEETEARAQREKPPARAWGMLAVTYLASICAPIVQFKIPPLANWLFANFASQGLDSTSFGLLMSAMGIIGVILAFPAAFICRCMGLKNAVLFSVACLAVGSGISAVAPNIPLLMFNIAAPMAWGNPDANLEGCKTVFCFYTVFCLVTFMKPFKGDVIPKDQMM